MSGDAELPRVEGFVKRLLQVSLVATEGFAAAVVCFLIELFEKRKELRLMIPGEEQREDSAKYDPRKRDPKYAEAQSTNAFELLILVEYFHPSVAKLVEQLRSP